MSRSMTQEERQALRKLVDEVGHSEVLGLVGHMVSHDLENYSDAVGLQQEISRVANRVAASVRENGLVSGNVQAAREARSGTSGQMPVLRVPSKIN